MRARRARRTRQTRARTRLPSGRPRRRPSGRPSPPPTSASRPTPDDGRRLSAEQAWDESTRPVAPTREPGAAYTEAGRRDGQALVQIHDHLRAELATLRDLVEQVAEGNREIGEARSLISTMTMRQNSWTLGTYCETYCRIVTVHHTIEDQRMFPGLRAADPALAPVIDRLEEEHHAIARVLERVDASLVGLVAAPDEVAAVRAAVDLLTDTLLSHLSYEERELVEPLARLGIGLV